MAHPTLRPLGFGEILDGAFTLYRRNFATFALTSLIAVGGMIVGFAVFGGSMIAAMTSGNATTMAGAAVGSGLLMMVIVVAAMLIMYGALARQAAQAYTGQPTSVADGFRAGLRAALPLLGAGLLAGIGMVVMIFAISLVMGIVVGILANMGGAFGVLGTILMVLAIMAVYVGAIAMLFAVLPAVVVEGAGPLEALERSFELARGAVLRVVGLMVVTVCITYLPLLAVLALTGGFAAFTNPGAVPTAGAFVMQQVLTMGVSILTTPFMVAVIVLAYFDRRVRTEALDVQMMADRLAVAGN